MYIYYDSKTDFLEVIERKCENFSRQIEEGVFEIRSKKTRKRIGYSIQDASEYLDELKFFDPLVKLSIYIKMARLNRGFTQAQMAKKMKIDLLPYQRLESGTNNPTLKTLLKLKAVLPEVDLEKIAA